MITFATKFYYYKPKQVTMSKQSLKFIVLIMAVLMMQSMGIGAALSAKSISGTVLSSTDNEPLIGATVQVDGAQEVRLPILKVTSRSRLTKDRP